MTNKKKIKVCASICADIFHHGHLNILLKAKKKGSLTVALMTDRIIKRYKKRKPLLNYQCRKKIISELKCVDKIIPVSSLNFSNLVKRYKFDYFFHGDDWKKGVQAKYRIKLIKEMKKWKGKVIDIKYTRGISSSKIKKFLNV